MLAILGLILPAFGNFLTPLFSFLTTKQNTELAGAQTAMTTDAAINQAVLAAQIQSEQIKAANNTWIGAKIIGFLAGEISVIYYGAIVADSVYFHSHSVEVLPAVWNDHAWIILSSFILVAPTAPALGALSSWLAKR